MRIKELSMAEIEKSEDEQTLDGGESRNHQSEHTENSEKMLKPWMKNLGKEFYMDEDLAKYDSLPEMVKALKSRPEPKNTPDSYGEEGDVEKAYKKAGLTKEEAEAISAAYKPLIPEKPKALGDVFGDRLDSVLSDYQKGIDGFADDLKDTIGKKGWDKDPDFVSIMSRIGKETGEDRFSINRNSRTEKDDPATRMIKQVYGK